MKKHRIQIDESQFKKIDPKIVAEANERIRKAMIPVVRDFKKKSKISELRASKILVL